ncbi:F-box/FBD/LRR-repeat protein At1g13570 isoform X2 [Hevea brasiliensis]|uniref:F-box/FBD/LRR-repeat protein At1g13570 isoform X2 n=1 Tax=Hevea brasiliensis TaxID=3981 RepID=UPI0025F8B94A|nr:F-box/FBD/LRR-repeat protein At1g13570 isoform X2 [Hevea brasiliensis]
MNNTRKHQKSIEMENQTKIDRISNLPWDVLDIILVHLPLREAARTSVLSSKWRYKWTGLSQFVFDDKCIHSSMVDKAARWMEIMKIINKVQSSHSGPIEKFKLAAYCCPNQSDFDQWIAFLTKKGIKELIIQDFSFIKRFKLPSCVFCCPKLSCLELFGCIFKLPAFFKGFDCLKSLKLSQVFIVSDTLESLICNCPALERLTLLNIDHLAFVRIHNPNLKYLKLDSKFEDICFGYNPLLVSVDIRMIPMYGWTIPWRPEQGKVCNLIRVLGSFGGINRLCLYGQFLEFLANEDVPQRLPTMLNCLSALEIREVETLDEVHKPVMDFVISQCLYDFYLNQLKVVNIRGIVGTRTELEFIKLLLAHSPMLESMTIVKYSGERILESVLLQLERASEHVKFISLTL